MHSSQSFVMRVSGRSQHITCHWDTCQLKLILLRHLSTIRLQYENVNIDSKTRTWRRKPCINLLSQILIRNERERKHSLVLKSNPVIFCWNIYLAPESGQISTKCQSTTHFKHFSLLKHDINIFMMNPSEFRKSKNLIWLSLAFLLDFILLWWGQYSHVSRRWILLRSECNRTNCKFTITIQIFVRHAVVHPTEYYTVCPAHHSLTIWNEIFNSAQIVTRSG